VFFSRNKSASAELISLETDQQTGRISGCHCTAACSIFWARSLVLEDQPAG